MAMKLLIVLLKDTAVSSDAAGAVDKADDYILF